MHSISPDTEARFATARDVAHEAGRLALDYFEKRESLLIETKSDPHDVVSKADRDVEQLIRDRIHRDHPDDAILGEEYGLEPGTSGFTWVIDPIDGTSPFVHGMPNWCVSIGLVYEGEPVVGVIEAPCFKESYCAAKGMGATLNGKPLRIDPDRTLRNGVTGIGANHHVQPAVVGEVVTRLLGAGGNFFRNGSGALMLAYVAAGRLVGYYEPYMHAWDCMAGFCLVKEAGGDFRDFPTYGESFLKGAPVLAAGAGAIRDLHEIAGL